MVVNALGFVSRPLHLTPEFFRNKPLEQLVGEGVEPKDLNDDCLERALDALFEHGITELFVHISSHAPKVFGFDVSYATWTVRVSAFKVSTWLRNRTKMMA